jgi:hypothetical protein
MGLLIFLSLFLVFAFVILFVISSAFLGFLITRVPFVPTSKNDIEFIVNKLGISPKDIFYDLGSGNGKVVFLVEKLSGAKAKGFERTLWTHWWAKLQKILTGSKAQFSNKNFFKADWSGASIIYCYLYPPLMGNIEDKFKAEMKPGSIAIVRDFPFPKMPYAEKYYLPKEHEIYVYRI